MNTLLFDELLKNFCQDFDRSNIDENIPNIFIPHTMYDYENAPIKIFYIGRDTNRWGKLSVLFTEYFDKNNLLDYLPSIAEWMNELGFLEYNKNNAGGFWTLAMRLHLKLKGINEIVPISENIPESMKKYLNDFGWGNINSIETMDSLSKRKYELDNSKSVWQIIDKAKYLYTKQRSEKLDKLKYIVDTYAPDFVFIFNWSADEKKYLEGLEVAKLKKHEESKVGLWEYSFKGVNTKLIWTEHPGRLRYNKMNLNELVEILSKLAVMK